MLRAELVPDRPGSRLVGRFGVPPQVRALAAVMLALCAVFVVIAVVGEVRAVATGTWTPGLLLFLAGSLVFAAAVPLMAGGQDAVGRADDEFLLTCLAKVLGTPDDAHPDAEDA